MKEVYIIIPEKDEAFFVIFEDEGNTICFLFNVNVEELSKALKFKLRK